MNRNLCVAAFAVGLAAILWVGGSYLTHPLALTMTLLIGAVYLMGAREMLRFHQATQTLDTALVDIPANLPSLDTWLARLPASLQNTVRLRIEGERVALPGPALTPYLIGLLVMLGMLGTFLGMVVTLSGVGLTLENTTDLQTIRSSLSAPIKGLGLAFGTSVAGVSASAMLGLISAVCRRARQASTQVLDTRIAAELRPFSVVHQRQETFRALQFQAQAMPEVVDKLQALMETLERHQVQMNERLLNNQDRFHQDVKGVYTELATAVDRSLKTSLTESARAAGETLQPFMTATLDGLAKESQVLQSRLADTVKTQLDGIAERFGSTVQTVESQWQTAVTQQAATQAQLNEQLGTTLTAFTNTFEQRAQGLADHWDTALNQHERSSQQLVEALRSALTGFADTFEQRSATLLANVQAGTEAQDARRLTALAEPLATLAETLKTEWQVAGAQTLAQQQAICATLEKTAQDMTAQAQAQASETIAEITKLMQTAAEAPKAAAEVIGQLRQEISTGIARDNALLDERARILETLNSLLDTINHAAAEQRGAIDALVASSADRLQQISTQFSEQIGSESSKVGEVAGQVGASAIEMASLGETLGFAVQQFSEANGKMIDSLQRIEASLDKSMARSDEQMAYYVAQAREIIDLSILSQKQVVEDLRALSGKNAVAA